MMFDMDMNFLSILNLFKDDEQYFLEISSNDQQEIIENRLENSSLISYDNDKRMMVNIKHVDNDYLLKSVKETSGI